MIVDFTHQETKWLQVSIIENGQQSEVFNIIFDQFLDHKRKECHVDFRQENDVEARAPEQQVYLYYEAQLIDNELEYFTELQEMNLEDREVIKNSRNDFLEIKRKLAGLFKSTSINERVAPLKELDTLNNLQGVSTERKINLSKVGEKHHNIRMSFVGKVLKSSMVPMEQPKSAARTDMYPVFPLIEEGRSQCADLTRRARRREGDRANVVSEHAEQKYSHLEYLDKGAFLVELCSVFAEHVRGIG